MKASKIIFGLECRYAQSLAAFLEKILHSKNHCGFSSVEVLRAADSPEYRTMLFSYRKLNSQAAETLRNLCHPEGRGILDPSRFTNINNLTIYFQALCAFPLIQNHPHFDKLHLQTKLFFLLRERALFHPNEKLPVGLLADYVGVSRVTIHYWLKGTFRPRLLGLLEKRAATLPIHKRRAEKLRKAENDICSLDDLVNRISHESFVFSDKLRVNPNFEQQLNDAANHLHILSLVETGYHPSDLAMHFNIHKDSLCQTLRQQFQPRLIRLASKIPKRSPNHGYCWVPTFTSEDEIPDRFIQASPKIYDYEQLLPVFKQLVSLTNLDSHPTRQISKRRFSLSLLKMWTYQFGSIETIEDKIHSFGYIIGTALSDGHIALESTYSSQFKIELSSVYSWSKTFGDRVAYYLTCIGIPTKRLEDIPANPPEKPNPSHIWKSVKTPFLTWIKEGVLGFEPGQTHSDYPAKIDWVLNAPRVFQIKILQGLFDGDGWVSVINSEIGISSKVNTNFIEQLLLNVDIKSTKCESNQLLIKAKNAIRQAVTLPLFLSATAKIESAKKIVQMLDKARSSVTAIDNIPLIQRILELGLDVSLSIGQIRLRIYEEYRITLSYGTIKRILAKGNERLKINYGTVRTYFRAIELNQRYPTLSSWKIAKTVKENTEITTSIETLRGWFRGHVPRDVKRALSKGYPISKELLQAYPYLQQYLPK